MRNSIETAVAIAFFGTIAIDIAIAKAVFKVLLLILLRKFSKYCYCYLNCKSNVKFSNKHVVLHEKAPE